MAEGQYQKSLNDKIDSIPLYEMGLEEISKKLDKRVEVMPDGDRIRIYATSDREMRVKAYQLGADAISDYKREKGKDHYGDFSTMNGIAIKYL